MKKTLLLITSLLIITSTVFPQSTVNINSLQEYGEKAIKINPDYAFAYSNLGNAYYDQGNTQQQISNYKKAARLGHQPVQDWLERNGYNW